MPVPWYCTDGFLPAFWQPPEAYLDPALQQSMSFLQLLDPEALARGLGRLRGDIEDGTWERRNGALRAQESLDVGWRIICTRETVTHYGE